MRAYKRQTTLGWHHFVQGKMNIDWGELINNQYWKHILQLWAIRNQEVHGETPEQIELIHRTTMIAKIVDIQNSHQHLPLSACDLISRDEAALRAMSTPQYHRIYMAPEC
jgi:predicted Abi (CAAX) family protease